MLQPPPLTDLPRIPVTIGIASISLAMTGWWWMDSSVIEWAGEDFRIWDGMQLWRAFTSVFLHLNLLHIAFNVYWWVLFGAFIELRQGPYRLLGIFLLLAFCSSLAEFVAFNGGVGLSGVVYGLWAMLAILERQDERFKGAVDAQTNQLFVGWFFLCILTTLSGTMPIANVAHGVGALTGAMLGFAFGAPGVLKRASAVCLALLAITTFVAAVVLWPRINFSDHKYEAVEYVACQLLDQGDTNRALKLLEIATQKSDANAVTWYNLGVAHHQREDLPLALAAYEEATRRSGATDNMRKMARELKDFLKQGP